MKNKKDFRITVLSAIILSIATFLGLMPVISAQQANTCPMTGVGGMMYGGYGSGFLVLSWITYILVIVLIIAGIYWLVKSADNKK